MSAAIIVFCINILTSVLKTYIAPKFGKTGVQVAVFVLALLGAAYYQYFANIPTVKEYITMALALFALAVSFYEVILSKIPLFKQEEVIG